VAARATSGPTCARACCPTAAGGAAARTAGTTARPTPAHEAPRLRQALAGYKAKYGSDLQVLRLFKGPGNAGLTDDELEFVAQGGIIFFSIYGSDMYSDLLNGDKGSSARRGDAKRLNLYYNVSKTKLPERDSRPRRCSRRPPPAASRGLIARRHLLGVR